ncbi:hypothetical protein GIB67_010769 [Kingdonia uniflora]|uniref:Condensin-2 complex subunit G2 n=1 Tax=Kingdonia uniflora TaxID=39325 RepID=A0A7J7L8X0_9MAGN|nr:hypothetical protein GIB67_010769 [Kingdonia uniflora]
MEKRLRSSLQTSADAFLSSATQTTLKSSKPSLKTLIFSITSSNSPNLISSLPLFLHQSISRSIASFQLSDLRQSSCSPPTKRARRSSRKNKELTPNPNDCSRIGSKKKCLIQSLEIYTHIVYLCVSHPKRVFSANELLPCAQMLHDSLVLFELEIGLLGEVANLCEVWWKEGLFGRETLISQFIPFVLSKSLTSTKKVDVHMVYGLREAFSLFDFEDESIEDLKVLLVRCVITPLYLKVEEGRRFIAFLFGLSGQLAKEALAIIKSQIPSGRKSMLEAFADIVVRAWKVEEGGCKYEIENGFLKGLIEGAIYANSRILAASTRKVLSGFITQRTTKGVGKLIFDLIEPVIFRSLQVANSNVRQNALHLLLDVFPIEDPDATKEVKDSLLEKQFFLLDKLLLDECPDVRVVTVEGSCRILHLFWEIIPSSAITNILTKIVDEMSHDICIEVRLSTLSGIIYLLGNPQSHDILKVLLPRLGHMFSDSSLSVRVAVANLLLDLRNIRTFQFQKVVNLDALLSSLANDQPLVAQSITRLLVPSYFPMKASPEEACSRCITLIKKSPMAGARFCEFLLSEGSSTKSLIELFRVSITLALSPDDLNADQIEGFLVAASNLCSGLVNETSCKSDLKKFISGEKLKHLFTAATTSRAQSSIFSIASVVSPADMSGLVQECINLVKNCAGLSANMERQTEARSAHKLIMSCGKFNEMFGALTNLLHIAALGYQSSYGTQMSEHSVSSANPPKKARLSMKSSIKLKYVSGKNSNSYDVNASLDQHYGIAAGAAWQVKDLLSCLDSRGAVLVSPMLGNTFSALKVISEVIIEQSRDTQYLDTTPISAYTTLALHTYLQNVDLNRTNILGNKNDELDSSSPSLEMATLGHILVNIFGCTEKLFSQSDSGSSSNSTLKSKMEEKKIARRQRNKQKEAQTNSSSSTDDGPCFPVQKRMFNMLKVATAVLKFVVDANTVCFVSHHKERCLKFTSSYVHAIISTLRKLSNDQLQFEENDMKEILVCLRSSFTYASKLLNLVLSNTTGSSSSPPEASDLANDLLNLIISTDLYLELRHTVYFVAAAKPWVSDLILALGSWNVLDKSSQEIDHPSRAFDSNLHSLPWLRVLAKLELSELGQDVEVSASVPEQNTYFVFNKVMEIVVLSLRRNPKVLDSVGVIILTGLATLLETEEYELVSGLAHFVCMKLARHENGEWEELESMLALFQEIFLKIAKAIEDPRISEDGRHILEGAKANLEPVWMSYIYKDGGSVMEEE